MIQAVVVRMMLTMVQVVASVIGCVAVNTLTSAAALSSTLIVSYHILVKLFIFVAVIYLTSSLYETYPTDYNGSDTADVILGLCLAPYILTYIK